MTEVAQAANSPAPAVPRFPFGGTRTRSGGNAEAQRLTPGTVRKRPALLWVLSLATLGSGLVNLYSLIGPALPARMRLLLGIFPLEFLHLSRFLTLLIGFALAIGSINIYKRKKRAFQIVSVLACFSVVFHLTKGLDYEEALFSFALLLGLILTRKQFTVRSSVPDLRGGLLRLALALGIGVCYGVAGFWLLDRREFGIDFSLRESLQQTFSFLLLAGGPDLVPRTHYARWFLDSLYLMTVLSVGYACIAVFRPALYALRTLPYERTLAQENVSKYGRSSLDYFKTWPDKSFFFSPSNRCFLAYGVAANFALVLADPVGPEEEIEPTVRAFMELCAENDWALGFHQTLPDFLPIYKRLGFRKLKIGDDAIVDLTRFTLEGKAMKELRSKVNLLEKQGVHTVFHAPPISDEALWQAKTVSDEWLGIPGRRERRFSLGLFEPHYVRSAPLFAAADSEGRWLAFVNIVPSYAPGESTIDLMRRRTEAPNGIMDYLFVKLLLHLKEKGFQRFDFGMAPMSGFQEREEASPEERAVHFFFQHLNFLFSYRGLRHYKAKFATSWEPRYAIYRNPLDLPRLAIALRKLSEIKEEWPMQRFSWCSALLASLLLAEPLLAQAPTPGKNLLPIRGQQQEIYFYHAAPGSPQPHPKVLFAPGDFGMWGFAVTMARTMASWGYDVYGLDTKQYLESFRTKTSALKEAEVMGDFRTIIRWITGGTDEKVVLVGWSEGAGLCLLAAAPDDNKNHVAGLITLGMTETNSLAWRWSDLLSYVTGKDPNEPLFKSAEYLSKVAPVPLLMLQASRDQYVTVEAAKQLFSIAQEPKRFRLIEARNHRFEGNQEELFQAIREGLQWTRQTSW